MTVPAALAEVVSDFADVQGQDKLALLLEFANEPPPLPSSLEEAAMDLGVPVPTSAPILSSITGAVSGTASAISVVWTYVDDNSWEGAPSPAGPRVTA